MTAQMPLPDARAAPATRPRIAFMGEFSAGKSTAINTVLGAEVLPTAATATRWPTVWIAHGEVARNYVLDAEGLWRGVSDLDLASNDLRRFAGLRLERPLPALQVLEVIDTPGISDPSLDADPLALATALADAAIWCTPANQAWRQSEVARWRAVPEAIRRRSLLLITRADVLGGERNRAKVLRRLRSEAANAFDAMQLFDGREAARLSMVGAPDKAAWEACGGAALAKWLTGAAETGPRAGRLVGGPAPDPEPAPAAVAEAPEDTPAPVPAPVVRERMHAASGPAEPAPMEDLHRPQPPEKEEPMTKMDNVSSTDISALGGLAGFIGACLVDSESGLMLGSEGGANFDLEAAAAGNTEVVKAKNAAKEALGLDDYIEDILITLGTQYHLIRPLADMPSVFLYVALDKKAANLGMARLQAKKVEGTLSL